MSGAHRALVVEDHPQTAEDLAEILRSMECNPTIAPSREAALASMESQPPCLVLLDLSIPASPKHIKGRPDVGISLLHDIRQRFGSFRMQRVWLPVVVVSGHATEPDQVADLMKIEADDVIQKPYREEDVVRKVNDALKRSGRHLHSACEDAIKPAPRLVLDIPGRPVKRRTLVQLGGRDLPLTDSDLCTLMHLLVARVNGHAAQIQVLGNTTEVARKRVDRLRKEFSSHGEKGTSTIVSHGGAYSLSDDIALGSVDAALLASRGHAEVAKLAIALSTPSKGLDRDTP